MTENIYNLLREYFTYNPDTGDFIRLKCYRPKKIGEIAQVMNKQGRYQLGFAGRCHLAHRMAWLYVYGELPDGQIDHIDGDPKNNRIGNLRVVTNCENHQNLHRANVNNKSGLLGVIKTAHGKFSAQIKKNYRSMHIGTYDTAEEAHKAYLEVKRELHPFGEISKETVKS